MNQMTADELLNEAIALQEEASRCALIGDRNAAYALNGMAADYLRDCKIKCVWYHGRKPINKPAYP